MVPQSITGLRRNPRVKHVDDERGYGHGYFVYTAPGWAFDPDPDEGSASHVRSFQTAREAVTAVRRLEPCTCGRCQRGSAAP